MRVKLDWVIQWALALGFCLGSNAGIAQQEGQIQFAENKANLACMLPAEAERGAPTYPAAAWEEQLSATVNVRLSFTAPNAEPKIEVLGKQGSNFEEAVTQYVKRYRLPCFVPGQAPIEVKQQFRFNYGDGRTVVYSSPSDGARSTYESCVISAKPVYPPVTAQSGEGGNVILTLSFSRRGAAPDVKVVYGGHNRWLLEAAVEAAQKYTFSCELPGGAPLVATQQFVFRVEDGQAYKLNDMNLKEFLRSVDRSGFGKVHFDLRAMGCPFELNVALFRPYMPNRIGEFETSDPSRKDFMEWLSQLNMQFPKGAEQYLIGKSLKLSVPCAVLDFT